MSHPAPIPSRCFWELTRRCRLRCIFCRADCPGDGAGELPLRQALNLASQIAGTGISRVVLTGGEPVLYSGWDRIAQTLSSSGVSTELFTSGFGFLPEHLKRATDAGIVRFRLSLDGNREVHDRLRPPATRSAKSSWEEAIRTLDLLLHDNRKVTVVTQVSPINIDSLEAIATTLLEKNISHWQVHLCQLSGRAAQNRDILMCSENDIRTVFKKLVRFAAESRLSVPLHCSLGYMTPEEKILRPIVNRQRGEWSGCPAGIDTFAITPDGRIKGCTTLDDDFAVGSIRTQSLVDILRNDASFPYTRQWSPSMLEGHCATCEVSARCRGGCPAVAFNMTGSIGANPLCLRHIRQYTD